MANIEELDFKLIIDDSNFNNQVEDVKKKAQELNTEVSNLLNVKANSSNISAKEHQSRMRQIKEEAAQIMANQKQQMALEMERTKIENERAKGVQNVAKEEARVINEKKKGLVIDEQIATASQKRIAAENQTASAAAIAAQKKVAAEEQAAAAVQKRVAAEQNALRAAKQRETSEINKAVAEERLAAATNARIASQERLNAELERENKSLLGNSKLMTQLKNLATGYFSVLGASRLISNLVRVSAEFEKQRISLEAILKDVNGADAIFEQIKGLAVMSPFTFKELVTYTKQLSAFSVPMNELYDTTKMLADVSAGLGVGMDRLILAYGQIRSASFLRGQEVRQLTEAGVPILRELSQQLTELEGHFVSVGEVFDKISARQVTFEMVEKVFKGMTEEGGKFYQMQEVLAETLSGKISNLKDAYQIMFSEIGEKSNGILVKSVDALRSLANNYETVGRKLLEIVAIYGVYKAAVPITQFIQMARVQAALAKAEGMVAPALEGATAAFEMNTAAMLKNNAVAKLNIYALVAAAVVALGFAIYESTKNLSEYGKVQKIVTDQANKFASEINNEEVKLSFLFKQLENATKGTEEYELAKKKILNTYDQYLTDIDRENLALGKQVEVYQKLKVAIREAVAQKAMEEGMTDIGKVLQSSTEGIMNQFDRFVKLYSRNTNTKVADTVWDQIGSYIRGEIDKDAFTKEGKELYESVMEGVNLAQQAAKGGKRTANDWLVYGNLEGLRSAYEKAGQIAEDGMASLQAKMNRLYGPLYSKGEEAPILQEWAKDIQAIIDEAAKEQITINLKVDENSTLATVVDDIRTNIEDTTKSYELAVGIDEKAAAIEKKRLGYLERINAAVKYKGTPGGSGGGGADPTKDRVRAIKAEIDAYKTLKDAYQSLIEYMDETAARNAISGLSGVFGLDENADFDAEINRLIFELGNLGDAGMEAAQSLLQGFAMDAFRKYQEEAKKSAEATKEFEDMLKSMDDVFSLAGLSGVSLDIAKIGNGYRDALNKIAEERAKAIESLDREAFKSNMSDSEYENNLNKIFGFFDIQEANERTEAIDKVRDAISKYYTEARDYAVDFNNLGDKSITQLQQMKEDISELAFKEIDPKVLESFKAMGLTIDDVINIIEKLIKGDLEKLDEETEKLTVKSWKQIASDILKVTDALKQFGEEAGNQQLVDFANFANGLADIVKSAAAGFTAGGVPGAVIGGVSAFAVKMLEVATNAERVKNELKEIATRAYLEDMSKQIAATSTIFGDSWVGKVTMIQSKIAELKREIASLGRATGGSTFFGTYHAVLLDRLTKYGKELGMALYDEDGTFNSAFLEAVDTAYSKDLKNVKIYDEFQRLRDYNDALKKRFEELNDAIGQIFSDIGESITDELIDKLWQTGEVVSDLEDVFQGLGNTIMKSLIQSIVVDEILSKYRDQVTSWFTTDMSADQLAEEVDRFANNVREDIESSGDVIKAIFDAFSSRNLISGGEASESALTNGIKGVTEETASLLASYINAIRADVAYNRLQLEDVRGDVRMMVGLLPSTPTLAEYLTQIQANTFNTATRTEAILLHLEELTTAEGGAAALRVFM